jgi:NDP-sugar pyrophosphorylase family protein
MPKTRISLSMDANLLAKLDRDVDHRTILSRSEAVERIIENYLDQKKKCVILAGGKPEALRSDGSFRPLLPVKGNPLILDIIAKVRHAGYENIIIIGSREVLSEIFRVVGESGIEYIEEKEHLGTAKTLALARQRLTQTFLFVPCDHYFELDLQQMEIYHKHNKGAVTLAVYSGKKYQWQKSSIVELEGNLITSYVEHPKKSESYLTALMIGFAEPEIFNSIPTASLSYSLQEEVFVELAKQRKLVGYLFSGRWKNIHTRQDTKL